MEWKYGLFSLFSLCLFTTTQASQAEVLLDRSVLGATENAVVMPDGRYFVAGDKGVFEVKRALDTHPNCTYDGISGLTACLQVAKPRQSWTSFFSGMTTDGEHLYAAYTEWDPLLLMFGRPKAGALYKIHPGMSEAAQVQIRQLATPVWYNGMVMLDENTLLMSASQSGTALNFAGPALTRLDITNADEWEFQLSDWLPAAPGMLLPNGLVTDHDFVYLVGGQSLFKIKLQADYSAGELNRIYKTGPLHFMDDLTLAGDTLAVTEFSPINGLVKNFILLLDKSGQMIADKIPTGKIQLSSLAVDSGSFGNAGDLIGTSFFQGGMHLFEPTAPPPKEQSASD